MKQAKSKKKSPQIQKRKKSHKSREMWSAVKPFPFPKVRTAATTHSCVQHGPETPAFQVPSSIQAPA
jgi:hypothetical protein